MAMTEEELDRAFAALRSQQPAAPKQLTARVIASAPVDAGVTERLLIWLSGALWRVAAVAAMPLLIGFGLGVAANSGGSQEISNWYLSEDPLYAATFEEYDNDEI